MKQVREPVKTVKDVELGQKDDEVSLMENYALEWNGTRNTAFYQHLISHAMIIYSAVRSSPQPLDLCLLAP